MAWDLLPTHVFSLPAGALGARFGTRRMLQVGFVLAAVGMGLLPAAQFLSGNEQVAWIVATYTLTSMGLDAYFVNSNPFMIQFTTPRERMYLYSLRVGMSPMAAFVGALVGGFLPGTLARLLPITDTASFALALLVAPVALLIGVVALFSTRAIAVPAEEEDRPERTGSAASTALPVLLITMMGLVIMLRMAAEGAQRTFFNVYLEEILVMPTAHIGMLAACGQLVGGFGALSAPFLTRRWSLGARNILGNSGDGRQCRNLCAHTPLGRGGGGICGIGQLYLHSASLQPALYDGSSAETLAGDGRRRCQHGGGDRLGYDGFFRRLLGRRVRLPRLLSGRRDPHRHQRRNLLLVLWHSTKHSIERAARRYPRERFQWGAVKRHAFVPVSSTGQALSLPKSRS